LLAIVNHDDDSLKKNVVVVDFFFFVDNGRAYFSTPPLFGTFPECPCSCCGCPDNYREAVDAKTRPFAWQSFNRYD
jgi:hypothetical protein